MNSHHLKVQESIYDRFFFLLRSLRRPAVLTFRKIIILPLDDPAFPLRFRDIQVRHMKSVLLPHPIPDLLVCSALLKSGHVPGFKREFISDSIYFPSKIEQPSRHAPRHHYGCRPYAGTYPKFRLYAETFLRVCLLSQTYQHL